MARKRGRMILEEEALRRFQDRFNLLVILGPTASGKTGLAVCLARRFGGEILSADSRQVYRGMDLGTGKELSEYGRGGEAVPVHLIDVCDPLEEFSLFAFQQLFFKVFQQIMERGRFPLMVGGTGLYLEAIIRKYRMVPVPENAELRVQLAGEEMEELRRRFHRLRPDAHNSTDLLDRERLIRAIEIADFQACQRGVDVPTVKVDPFVLGIRWGRETLRQRITARLKKRLKAGMIEEVRRLHGRGVTWQRLDAFGLEYRYITLYLQGKLSEQEMFRTLNTRIHQFAKRQETWFRGMERKGVVIHWIEGADEEAALRVIGGSTD